MHPIVIIPGMGGSVLVKRGMERRRFLHTHIIDNRWLNIEPFSPFRMDKWKKDNTLELEYDDKDKIKGYKNYDTDIIPHDLGGTEGISNIAPELSCLDDDHKLRFDSKFNHTYFAQLCHQLRENHGYRDYTTLHGLPYDFRTILDPIVRFYTFMTLQKLIEWTVKMNQTKAVICSHSLGGLLFKLFIGEHVSQEWVDKYIHRFVAINVPWGGVPNSVKICYFGDYYVPFFREQFRDYLKTNSGVIMTLPNHNAYNHDEVFLTASNAITGVTEHVNLKSFSDNPHISFKIWRDLYSETVKHLEKKVAMNAVIVNGCGFRVGTRYRNSTVIETDDGDSVVPKRSLNAFQGLFVQDNRLLHINLANTQGHVGILKDPRILRILLC